MHTPGFAKRAGMVAIVSESGPPRLAGLAEPRPTKMPFRIWTQTILLLAAVLLLAFADPSSGRTMAPVRCGLWAMR